MNRRRELTEIAIGVAVLAGAFTAVRLLVSPATQALYFGWPAGAVYSNLIASVICVAVAWWRIRTRMITHHARELAQAARHHREQLEQADAHHKALTAQAAASHDALTAQSARQHEEQLDHAEARHKLLTALADRHHQALTACVTAPAPQGQSPETAPRAKVRSRM